MRLSDRQPKQACFNTQPPEGGWVCSDWLEYLKPCFNTQPPEGGWPAAVCYALKQMDVSTHSRPKAAGIIRRIWRILTASFNTQPPEGGWNYVGYGFRQSSSFNTQPPEGGWQQKQYQQSEPKAFQHTAARRRLGMVV